MIQLMTQSSHVAIPYFHRTSKKSISKLTRNISKLPKSRIFINLLGQLASHHSSDLDNNYLKCVIASNMISFGILFPRNQNIKFL